MSKRKHRHESKPVPRPVDRRCDCENLKCSQHKPGECYESAKIPTIGGGLCSPCAGYMPKEYIYPPHGTARR